MLSAVYPGQSAIAGRTFAAPHMRCAGKAPDIDPDRQWDRSSSCDREVKDITFYKRDGDSARYFRVMRSPAAQFFVSSLFRDILPVCDIVRAFDDQGVIGYFSREMPFSALEWRSSRQIKGDIFLLKHLAGCDDTDLFLRRNISVKRRFSALSWPPVQFKAALFDFENAALRNEAAMPIYLDLKGTDRAYVSGKLDALNERLSGDAGLSYLGRIFEETGGVPFITTVDGTPPGIRDHLLGKIEQIREVMNNGVTADQRRKHADYMHWVRRSI